MANNHLASELNFYENRSKQLKQTNYPVVIRRVDTSVPESDMISWHWHDEIEFIYVQSGNVYVTCEDTGITAKEGELIFINHQKKHFLSPASDEGYVTDSIIVHPNFILGFGQLELEQKYIAPIIHEASLKYLFFEEHGTYHQACTEYIRQILEWNIQKPDGYELLTKSALLQIWYLIYMHYTKQGITSNSKMTNQDEHRVKQAILYMQEHFMESITLDDIADSILVSKSECCRCFKRSLGITPFEYLMKYRIMEATKRMHKKSPESISEIAGIVGFNNTSYFNKIFKKYMNCTPTAYRNSIRKDFPESI